MRSCFLILTGLITARFKRNPMDLVRTVRSFCKGHKTRGCKVSDLHKEFVRKYPDIRLENFEQALLSIKSKTAYDLKNRCTEYVKLNGTDSYQKFIRECEYVSFDFWNKMTGEIKKDITQPSETPSESSEPLDERYQKLLPANWAVMVFSEKVSFVSKVQHKGFYDYILQSDQKLKDYFARMKNSTPRGLKLYVTIFAIPADSYSEEAKNLLKSFVDTLNMVGRARLQYVKCSDPNIIEIREVR